MKMLAASGVACALLSGRRSGAVAARAADLGIEHVFQGVEDKLAGLRGSCWRGIGLTAANSRLHGRRLVDLPVLMRCGLACAPREAPEAVRARVHYVTAAPAARGAVREVCELIMHAQGTLERALQEYLHEAHDDAPVPAALMLSLALLTFYLERTVREEEAPASRAPARSGLRAHQLHHHHL